MKKLLFILLFTFIGQQVFSQSYMVLIYDPDMGCADMAMQTIDNLGNIVTDTCLIEEPYWSMGAINKELNNIMALGYKLTHISSLTNTDGGDGGIINSDENVAQGGFEPRLNTTVYILTIPWSASGLEEVTTTLKSFIISPNPANTFVDISLDYSLKGESEVVFISEAGYISHKQSIGEILKNEKYNIDISKIPAGKYLVTIVNGKTYTTPQKLIVL